MKSIKAADRSPIGRCCAVVQLGTLEPLPDGNEESYVLGISPAAATVTRAAHITKQDGEFMGHGLFIPLVPAGFGAEVGDIFMSASPPAAATHPLLYTPAADNVLKT